jgi:hypothetical protein
MSALPLKADIRPRSGCLLWAKRRHSGIGLPAQRAKHSIIQKRRVFDLYFTFIPLLDFPSGIPMHLSAHQPQHQLAACERLNLRCDHESHTQNRSCAKRSGQITIFCRGLCSFTPVIRDLGEVCCNDSDSSRRSLELRVGSCPAEAFITSL